MDRPKFSSKEWDSLVSNLKGKHAKRMNNMLDELDDNAFRIVYPKLLEYVIPKMQRQEIIKENDKGNNVLQIQVINNISEVTQNIIDVESKTIEE